MPYTRPLEEPNPGEKRCAKCHDEFPASLDWFYSDKTQEDGLNKNCKACHEKHKRAHTAKTMDIRLRTVEEGSLAVLSDMLTGGTDVPHSAELLEKIVHAFGGVNGLAKHYLYNYLQAAPGSAVRQRMLADIVKLATNVAESGATQIPTHLLSDKDLSLRIAEFTSKFAGGSHGDDAEDEGADGDSRGAGAA